MHFGAHVAWIEGVDADDSVVLNCKNRGGSIEAFDEPYPPQLRYASIAASDVRFTITHRGSGQRRQRYPWIEASGAKTFTSSHGSASQPAGESASFGCGLGPSRLALLTSRLSDPALIAASTNAARWDASVTSPAMAISRGELNATAAASNSALRRASATTVQPRSRERGSERPAQPTRGARNDWRR